MKNKYYSKKHPKENYLNQFLPVLPPPPQIVKRASDVKIGTAYTIKDVKEVTSLQNFQPGDVVDYYHIGGFYLIISKDRKSFTLIPEKEWLYYCFDITKKKNSPKPKSFEIAKKLLTDNYGKRGN
jgi:hypothetical protein